LHFLALRAEGGLLLEQFLMLAGEGGDLSLARKR
jgi:hypothetical protein